MRRLIGWSTVLLVLLAVRATTADAVPVLYTLDRGVVEGAPVLTPSGAVTWMVRDGRSLTVMRAEPGGSPRPIAALPALADHRLDVETYGLHASDVAIAVSRTAIRQVGCSRFGCSDTNYVMRVNDISLAALGEPLRLVEGCGPAPGEPRCSATYDACTATDGSALSGGILAVALPCGIDGARGRPSAPLLAFYSAGGIAPAPLDIATGERLQAFADDLVLTSTPPDPATQTFIATQRRVSDDAVIRQLILSSRVAGSLRMAMGSDGTIAYADGEAGRRGLWVAQPAQDPRLRAPVSDDASPSRIVADQVLVVPAFGNPPEIVPVATRDVIVVRRAFDASPPGFDGRRIAYAVARCGGISTIVVQDAADAPPRALETLCVVARLGGTLRLGRRTASVSVTCPPGLRTGCGGVVEVRLRARRLVSRHRESVALQPGFYGLPPGRTEAAVIHLGRQARRFIAVHRALSATAVIRSNPPRANVNRAPTHHRALAVVRSSP
jgi:hypothetical protein